jgi:hypothetical protein
MSTIDEILGRNPVTEDSPPVQTARPRMATPARREAPKDKESEKLRNHARKASIVTAITGMTESDEESIIPDNAKRVDPFSTDQSPGLKSTPDINNDSPSEPSLANSHGEELIPPTAALVAPDVTPKVFQLVDPSQVPAPPKPTNVAPGAPTATPAAAPGGALDTILGRTPTPPQGGMPPMQPPITAESFMHTISPMEIKAKAAESLIPASAGGSSMPEHKEGDGKTIFNAVRHLVG